MNRPKFVKNINATLRDEMYDKIVKICEEKDMSLSEFFRDALKMKIQYIEKFENGK